MIDEKEYQEFEDSIMNTSDSFGDVGDEIIDSSDDFDAFDSVVSDIDFSELRGDFKKSLSAVNRKIDKKSSQRRAVSRPKQRVMTPNASRHPMACWNHG